MSVAQTLADNEAVLKVDLLAVEMERKWGIGRLRLLVSPVLRAKFDSQRVKFNEALRSSSDVLRVESQRMVNAYRALDKAAEANGASTRPEVWEIGLDGHLFGICRTDEDVQRAVANIKDGMSRTYWSLEEVARLLVAHTEANAFKGMAPGAYLERMRLTLYPEGDPVKVISEAELDDSDKLDSINWGGYPKADNHGF